MMQGKFWNTIGGIAWIIVSFKIFIVRQFNARGMSFDFPNDFISILAGTSSFILGVVWLYATHRKKPDNNKNDSYK
jgi:hypothetical protein